jgi:hypothetical protein
MNTANEEITAMVALAIGHLFKVKPWPEFMRYPQAIDATPRPTARAMSKRTVLAIGITPEAADLPRSSGLTPELIRGYIEAQIDQLRAIGYDVDLCLIDPGPAAGATLIRALEQKSFDCIVIGAGLREPPAKLLLFEQIINVVHAHARNARICFNTSPADTADAVGRWIEP